MQDRAPPTPKAGLSDVTHTAGRALLSMLPVVGGPAVELFNLIIQPPIERRRVEWMEDVGKTIELLELQGILLADLQRNEQFSSAVLHATQVAIRTHAQKKRRALLGCLTSVATGAQPDEVKQHIFIQLIDDLSSLHLQVLEILNTHAEIERRILDLPGLIEFISPALAGDPELLRYICKDLEGRRLIAPLGVKSSGIPGKTTLTKCTTPLAEQFLRFIQDEQ